MKIKKINIKKSLALLCVIHFIIYSFILFILYITTSYFYNENLTLAFPSLDILLEYEDKLKNDNFSNIPIRKIKNSSFIVFDENGKTVYASDNKIKDDIKSKDIDLINSADQKFFYVISDHIDDSNKRKYYIYLRRFDPELNLNITVDYCVLNENYEIVEGTLFANRQALTEEELKIITGDYDIKKDITKYEYITYTGELRTLVFVAPQVNQKTYQNFINESKRNVYISITIFCVAVIIQIFIFTKKIKKSIIPIKEAIIAYKENSEIKIDEKIIPIEFQSTVNEFKDLLDRLETTKSENEKITQEKYRMIADISHDLKTPLTVIKGFSEALIDHRVAKDKEEKYLNTIKNKAILANDLINSLFEYVQMEHPNYEPHLEKIELCEFVKIFLAEKYNEIEKQGFNLEINIPEKQIMMSLDLKLMTRLLENLIGNSIKYNPPNTTIFICILEKGGTAILSIADDGVGISDEIINQVFDPFITSNSSRVSGEGTGLGLSISKKIVELHEGRIQLITSKKKGFTTKFIISLPIKK